MYVLCMNLAADNSHFVCIIGAMTDMHKKYCFFGCVTFLRYREFLRATKFDDDRLVKKLLITAS